MPKINLTPPPLTEQQIKNFWTYIDKSEGQGPNGDCWEWKGAADKWGYGRIQIWPYGTVLATRLAFFLTSGRWPTQCVCHGDCNNPRCCRFDHLWEGTPKQNSEDMVRKGRSTTGQRSRARMHPETLLRGEQNHFAKLTEADILEIRRRYDQKERHRLIAADYRICKVYVSLIGLRKTWRHLA